MTEFEFFSPIYNTLGKEILESLPVLDIGDQASDNFAINFIYADDMKYNVMKGKDIYSRNFICIKTNVFKKNFEDNIKVVHTFYQKYTDEINDWVYCTSCDKFLIYNQINIQEQDFLFLEKRLRLLFEKGEINDITKDDLDSDDFVIDVDNFDWLNYIKGTGEFTIKFDKYNCQQDMENILILERYEIDSSITNIII